jgi:hypothetical protein
MSKKKPYRVVYNFRYEIEVEAESAEEAVHSVQDIDWDEWEETWMGPFVEFEVDNLVSRIMQDMMIEKETTDG